MRTIENLIVGVRGRSRRDGLYTKNVNEGFKPVGYGMGFVQEERY